MRRNIFVAVVIFLLALLASSVAWAYGSYHGHHHHGHHHHHHHPHSRAQVGIIVGAPLTGYWPGYYTRPPYYAYSYPPAIAMQSSPPVYIERGDEQDQIQQPPPAYWYYCNNPQGYYPYVRVCPKGWQQVPAQPPPNP